MRNMRFFNAIYLILLVYSFVTICAIAAAHQIASQITCDHNSWKRALMLPGYTARLLSDEEWYKTVKSNIKPLGDSLFLQVKAASTPWLTRYGLHDYFVSSRVCFDRGFFLMSIPGDSYNRLESQMRKDAFAARRATIFQNAMWGGCLTGVACFLSQGIRPWGGAIDGATITFGALVLVGYLLRSPLFPVEKIAVSSLDKEILVVLNFLNGRMEFPEKSKQSKSN